MVVFAVFGELPYQPDQFRHATLGRADWRTLVATRIAARLARVKPILDGTRQQPVANIPNIGLAIALRHLVAEGDGLVEA